MYKHNHPDSQSKCDYVTEFISKLGNFHMSKTVKSTHLIYRDGRYLLFYFRSDIDIFKPSIVDIDTDTCKLKLSFKLLKECNQ